MSYVPKSGSSNPLATAYQRRANPANRVLIIGGGKICENQKNSVHTPHPSHALTAALPKNKPGMWVDPYYQADVTDSHNFCKIVRADGPYNVVHFENVDSNVVASAGAMASAHACLVEGGTLIIETGGAGYQNTEARIRALLSVLGFNIEYCSAAMDGVVIVATKKFSVGPTITIK